MAAVADDLDVASELTQKLTDAYIANTREKAKPEQVQAADGTWPITECVDCGVDIPPLRLALGKTRCVGCQGDSEKTKRFHR
jgi:RNA polymerase-binding transcription factor DksA